MFRTYKQCVLNISHPWYITPRTIKKTRQKKGKKKITNKCFIRNGSLGRTFRYGYRCSSIFGEYARIYIFVVHYFARQKTDARKDKCQRCIFVRGCVCGSRVIVIGNSARFHDDFDRVSFSIPRALEKLIRGDVHQHLHAHACNSADSVIETMMKHRFQPYIIANG